MKKQQSMIDYVYESLKSAIYEQKLVPGQKLVENDISNSLSISRTPIRHAFSRLKEEGFLTILPNRGAMVINPSVDEIADAFIHRKQLELLASEKIMESISADDITRLKDLIQLEKETHTQKNLVNYIKVNKEFHYLLINSCNNRFLINHAKKMIDQTHIYLALYDRFYFIPEKKDIRGPNEHQMLIKYIEQNKAEAFFSLLATHITSAIDEYKNRVQHFHQAKDLFN